MGKHIGKYANAAAIQAAVDNFLLAKPYIAMDEQNTSIDFNKKEKIADLTLYLYDNTESGTQVMRQDNSCISTYTYNEDPTTYNYNLSTGLLLDINDAHTIYCTLVDNCNIDVGNIKKIVLGEGATWFRLRDFAGSGAKYQELVLPSTLTYVYRLYSLDMCNKITCKATTAPEIGDEFSGAPANGTLYVPAGSDYSSWFGENKLPSTWTVEYI